MNLSTLERVANPHHRRGRARIGRHEGAIDDHLIHDAAIGDVPHFGIKRRLL